MATSLETLHKDIMEMKKDLVFIKHQLAEDFELSDHAKKALAKARKEPPEEYIDHSEMMKKYG